MNPFAFSIFVLCLAAAAPSTPPGTVTQGNQEPQKPQEPASPDAAQGQPTPPAKPPASGKPPRSREDRLEDRLAPEPGGAANTAGKGSVPEAGADSAAPAPEATPAGPTGTPPPAPEDPKAGWQTFNSCALIVNEEPVTLMDLQRGVQRRAALQKRGGRDREVMFSEEIVDRARILLEMQGGKDLGFNPEQVDRFVRQKLKEDQEQAGSITQFAAELKQEGLNSFERKEEYYARVHRLLWEESVTGRGASPGGRVSQDSYVRPGFALFVQREAARRQDQSRSVKATQIVLRADGPGGAERTRQRLEDLRRRIENGEDMGELSEQVGGCVPGTKGLTDFLSLQGLSAANPAVGAFLDKAEPGELSPSLEFMVDGKPAGYILVRPEEYKVAKIPPFDDPAGQRNWIKGQAQREADLRVQMGLGKLLEAAYVWPPNLFQKPPATP